MEDLKQFGCTVAITTTFKEQCFNDLNAAKEMYDMHGVSVLYKTDRLFTDLLKANKVEAAKWIYSICEFNQQYINNASRLRLINLMIPKNYEMATWLLKTMYVGCEFIATDKMIIDAIETDNHEFVEICARQHGYTISRQVIAHVAQSENYDRCEWMCNLFSINPEEHGFSLYTGPKSALKTR